MGKELSFFGLLSTRWITLAVFRYATFIQMTNRCRTDSWDFIKTFLRYSVHLNVLHRGKADTTSLCVYATGQKKVATGASDGGRNCYVSPLCLSKDCSEHILHLYLKRKEEKAILPAFGPVCTVLVFPYTLIKVCKSWGHPILQPSFLYQCPSQLSFWGVLHIEDNFKMKGRASEGELGQRLLCLWHQASSFVVCGLFLSFKVQQEQVNMFYSVVSLRSLQEAKA